MSYQWLKNGVAISGATSAAFSMTSPSPGDGRKLFGDGLERGRQRHFILGERFRGGVEAGGFGANTGRDDRPACGFFRDGAGRGTVQLPVDAGRHGDFRRDREQLLDRGGEQQLGGGNYAVEVSNAYGSATSNASTLIPVVSQQEIASGQSVSLTASPIGGGPFTYQWQLNGVDLSGATGETLTISNAQSAQGGIYTVIISGPRETVRPATTSS